MHWLLDMFQTVDVGLVVLTADYKIQVWNGFMENHSGLTPRQVRDRYLFDLFSEIDEDWLEKAEAIVDGLEYDTRVRIPIELPDNELLYLFKMAHDRDMKFNDFVEDILKQALENYERNPELVKKDIEKFKASIPHGY